MKKLLLVLCLFLICTSSVNAAEYECRDIINNVHHSGNYNPQRDTASSCEWLKKFPNLNYNECLNRTKNFAKMYREGKCELIVEKKVNVDGVECTVGILEKSKEAVSYSCIGINTKQAMRKLKEMYP